MFICVPVFFFMSICFCSENTKTLNGQVSIVNGNRHAPAMLMRTTGTQTGEITREGVAEGGAEPEPEEGWTESRGVLEEEGQEGQKYRKEEEGEATGAPKKKIKTGSEEDRGMEQDRGHSQQLPVEGSIRKTPGMLNKTSGMLNKTPGMLNKTSGMLNKTMLPVSLTMEIGTVMLKDLFTKDQEEDEDLTEDEIPGEEESQTGSQTKRPREKIGFCSKTGDKTVGAELELFERSNSLSIRLWL